MLALGRTCVAVSSLDLTDGLMNSLATLIKVFPLPTKLQEVIFSVPLICLSVSRITLKKTYSTDHSLISIDGQRSRSVKGQKVIWMLCCLCCCRCLRCSCVTAGMLEKKWSVSSQRVKSSQHRPQVLLLNALQLVWSTDPNEKCLLSLVVTSQRASVYLFHLDGVFISVLLLLILIWQKLNINWNH